MGGEAAQIGFARDRDVETQKRSKLTLYYRCGEIPACCRNDLRGQKMGNTKQLAIWAALPLTPCYARGF